MTVVTDPRQVNQPSSEPETTSRSSTINMPQDQIALARQAIPDVDRSVDVIDQIIRDPKLGNIIHGALSIVSTPTFGEIFGHHSHNRHPNPTESNSPSQSSEPVASSSQTSSPSSHSSTQLPEPLILAAVQKPNLNTADYSGATLQANGSSEAINPTQPNPSHSSSINQITGNQPFITAIPNGDRPIFSNPEILSKIKDGINTVTSNGVEYYVSKLNSNMGLAIPKAYIDANTQSDKLERRLIVENNLFNIVHGSQLSAPQASTNPAQPGVETGDVTYSQSPPMVTNLSDLSPNITPTTAVDPAQPIVLAPTQTSLPELSSSYNEVAPNYYTQHAIPTGTIPTAPSPVTPSTGAEPASPTQEATPAPQSSTTPTQPATPTARPTNIQDPLSSSTQTVAGNNTPQILAGTIEFSKIDNEIYATGFPLTTK